METEPLIPFAEELKAHVENWEFKRKLILWFYYYRSWTQKQIMEETGIAQPTISKWIKRWKAEVSLDEEEGRGRSVSYSPKQEEKVIEKQKSDRLATAANIHRQIQEEGEEISYKQVLLLVL